MHYYNTGRSQRNGRGLAASSCAENGTCRRRPVVARSAFMRSEEIDRERAMSGWNPYYGEEEVIPEAREETMADRMMREGQPGMQDWMMQEGEPGMQDRMMREGQSGMQDRMMREGQPGMQDQRMPGSQNRNIPEIMPPYFTMPDYAQVLEEQKTAERDLRRLQSMYPEAAKMILPYIEEECDKMEYEGSTMYDEYPDYTTVQRLQQRIHDEVRDRLPEQVQEEDETEDVLSMQYHGPGRNRPGQDWAGDLIRVLLLQEMHHRRCRHRGCRRGRY